MLLKRLPSCKSAASCCRRKHHHALAVVHLLAVQELCHGSLEQALTAGIFHTEGSMTPANVRPPVPPLCLTCLWLLAFLLRGIASLIPGLSKPQAAVSQAEGYAKE